MIVRRVRDGLLLLGQDDHARLAGALAERLRGVLEPRGEFALATAEHDAGWIERDREPLFNPATGAPHSYSDMPDEPYLRIWERGIARAKERGAYVGLLVGLHGLRFFSGKPGAAERAFVLRERAWQDETLRALGLGGSWDDLSEPVRTHSAWLRWLDGLSLFVCEGWGSPWIARAPPGELTVRREAGAVTVEPWPFDSEIEFRVPAAWLAGASYPGEAELRMAIKAAEPAELSGVVRPA